MPQPNLYILASDNSPSLLPLLRSSPSLASSQDEHGYSLLHAAASYSHLDLLRTLVQEFHVDVNLADEDGETCLFVTETVEIARCLVEELGVDVNVRNNDGLVAQESIMNDGSFPSVAAYLEGLTGSERETNQLPHPSLPPPNVSVKYRTMLEQISDDDADVIDLEFKRRIEELATRENFHSEEGQRELRALVTDAIRAVNVETQRKDVRRRLD
jgi:ankyrin repeat protein